MRTVIVHYHIFKNSGTSFERLLDENFGDGHLLFDGPFRFSKIDQDELRKVILNTDYQAYSSHQLNLPVPTLLEVDVEPVVFVRHPLLRLRSIYEFGRRSPETVRDGDSLADLDFAGWVRLSQRDGPGMAVLSNAQTRNLAGVYRQGALQRRMLDGSFEFDLAQARRNLDSVKLLARTEFFDRDVPRFEVLLEERGIEFRYRRYEPSNRTASDLEQPLAQRLEALREELGEALYAELERYNRQDLELLEYVDRRLES